MKKRGIFWAISLFFLVNSGCEDLAKKPVDAKTRHKIDSISSVENRKIRAEIDSFYQKNHAVLLQKKVDSLKAVRLQEIDRQIKSVRGLK